MERGPKTQRIYSPPGKHRRVLAGSGSRAGGDICYTISKTPPYRKIRESAASRADRAVCAMRHDTSTRSKRRALLLLLLLHLQYNVRTCPRHLFSPERLSPIWSGPIPSTWDTTLGVFWSKMRHGKSGRCVVGFVKKILERARWREKKR